jgi:hypothetical protein
MRFVRVLLALLLVAAPSGTVACSVTSNDAHAAKVASLQVPLTAVGSAGTQYRLGAASFRVSGGPNGSIHLVLLARAGSSTTELVAALASGEYSVTLGSDWLLERMDVATRTWKPVEATLISHPRQTATATEQSISVVKFLFSVNGDMVQTGMGEIQADALEAARRAEG